MVNSFADYHENDLIIVNSIVTNYKHFGFALTQIQDKQFTTQYE